MRMMRTCILLLLVLLGLSAFAQAPVDPWVLACHGNHPAATAACKAALAKNPNDTNAILCLAMIHNEEGDMMGELANLRRYYQLAPASWQAQSNWPLVANLGDATGRWDDLAAIARDVIAAKGVSPELRASARLLLAETLVYANKLDEARAIWAKLGYLRKWRVIGPFDNISRSGFEKAYPPEQELDFAKTYPGKDNRPRAWYPLNLVTRSDRCVIGEALGDESESVYYAVTAVNVPTATPATLCFDPAGAGKIFLNGKLVFSDDLYRDTNDFVVDGFQTPVTLTPGWNTILVKLATSDEDISAAFRLRFITQDGEDMPALASDPMKATFTKSAALAPPPAGAQPAHVESATVRLIRKQPETALTALDLAFALRITRDYQTAADSARAALAKDPDNTWLREELSQTLNSDDQTDEAKAERELALKNPGLAEIELGALMEQMESLSSDEMIEKLRALRKRFPADSAIAWALAHTYLGSEMSSDATTTARAALQLAPGPQFVELYSSFLQEQELTSEAAKALAQGLVATPNHGVLLNSQAELFLQQGNAARALQTYQQLLALGTTHPYIYQQIADIYQKQLKNPKAAAAVLATARQQCPQDADLCAKLADAQRELGNKQDAIALYQTAIRLNPSGVSLREKLRTVMGEKPILDLAPATPPDPILAEAAKLKSMPGDSALVLLDECRTVIYPDFATDARHHLIIKIFDDAGAKHYAHIRMSGTTGSSDDVVEKARVIKADGKIQDMTDKGGYAGLVFPSLAAGDVIDVTYRVQDYHSGALARQFWSEWFISTPGAPVKLCRYVLITPPDLQFNTRAHGAIPAPTQTDVAGWRLHEWKVTDVPLSREEENAPGERDTETWMDISTIGSWADIVAWYLDVSGPRCVPDAALRAKAAELTKDAQTEEAKIRAIVNFVANKIKYQSLPFRMSAFTPTEGKKVLREQYGDCKDKAALITALLNAVNIKAEMVLLNTREDGQTPFLPSPRFNHAIVIVQTAHGPLWVDGTAEKMEYGNLPLPDMDVPALRIANGVTELAQSPVLPAEKNPFTTRITAKLGTDGVLTGECNLECAGILGAMLRSILTEIQPAQHDMLLREICNQFLANSQYVSGSFVNQDDPEKPLVIHLKFRADNYSSTAGDFLLVKLPWKNENADLETITGDPKRTRDLENPFGFGVMTRTLDLELPDGYAPEGLQPVVNETAPWTTYAFTYRMDGNKLHAEFRSSGLVLRVPFADLAAYNAILKRMTKESTRQLVFKKKA